MNRHVTLPTSPEVMVDAYQAAYHLNMPLYYLINAAKRQALGIPHYRIGRLLRFKISELDDWLLAHVAVGGEPPEVGGNE